jgi:hypothetical protein
VENFLKTGKMHFKAKKYYPILQNVNHILHFVNVEKMYFFAKILMNKLAKYGKIIEIYLK